MANKKNKRKVGRPTKIPKETENKEKYDEQKRQFEYLCSLQCTQEEICGVMGFSIKTLEKFIRQTYGEEMNFSKIFEQKRARGKISLRRTQFKLAETSPAMAIFLGKNYLGQKDNIEVGGGLEMKVDPLSESIENMLDEMAKDVESE